MSSSSSHSKVEGVEGVEVEVAECRCDRRTWTTSNAAVRVKSAMKTGSS